jgi:hypothetical protein
VVVQPVLKALEVPVRAVVLPMTSE